MFLRQLRKSLSYEDAWDVLHRLFHDLLERCGASSISNSQNLEVTRRGERDPHEAIRLRAGQQLAVYEQQLERGLMPVPTPVQARERRSAKTATVVETTAAFNRGPSPSVAMPRESAQHTLSLIRPRVDAPVVIAS